MADSDVPVVDGRQRHALAGGEVRRAEVSVVGHVSSGFVDTTRWLAGPTIAGSLGLLLDSSQA